MWNVKNGGANERELSFRLAKELSQGRWLARKTAGNRARECPPIFKPRRRGRHEAEIKSQANEHTCINVMCVSLRACLAPKANDATREAAMTPNRTVSPASHHRDGNYGEPIYCPTTGDPCEGKISRFCDNRGCARESGLANLWTRLNRPSHYELTSGCEFDQAEHESDHTDS